MVKRAHRLTDLNNGQGAIIEIPLNPTVFANGLLLSVDNSTVNAHSGHNPTVTSGGSQTVFAHGIPVNYEHNFDGCGHLRVDGSINVFVDNAGVSYLKDNTLSFTTSPPEGMQPYTSSFIQYIFEKDDTESADPVGTQAPGITAENYPIPDVIEENSVPSTVAGTPTQDCSSIDTLPPTFDWNTLGQPYNTWSSSFSLSPNFTLYDVTTGPAVSTWQLKDNVGLTQKEILQNLCFLAKTLLEPMLIHFPDMLITSGFRAKSGGSQHNKGQAVDVQIPGFTSQQYWDSALWIKDNINFDQFILEYGGNNPWYHLSINPTIHRHNVLTFKGSNVYVPGLVRVV